MAFSNSIATASRYSNELDKILTQSSKVGFLADNSLKSRFVGASTVIIPDVDFVGLGDYDRENGYAKGKTTVAQTSYTLSKDRGRQLGIDAQDMDETGVADLAGQVLGEFVRTQVAPEMDAYCMSKLYSVANNNGNKTVYNSTEAPDGHLGAEVALLINTINSVEEACGYSGDGIVAFVNPSFYSAIMTSDDMNRMITVSDFKQGDINLKVKTLNGCAIIPVSGDRMKTEFTFDAGATATAGGFSAADGAYDIMAIVMPKDGASLVKKTEKMRVFTPDQNIDADQYIFDYRLYYDLFVKKSRLGTIHCITAN